VPSPDKEQPATILWVVAWTTCERDAIQWFLTEVFPIVKERVPNAKCDVLAEGLAESETLRDR